MFSVIFLGRRSNGAVEGVVNGETQRCLRFPLLTTIAGVFRIDPPGGLS
jgi:hypothetical protein